MSTAALDPSHTATMASPSEETKPNWTVVKTKQVALYAFAALAALGAIILAGLSLASIIPWPCVFIAIPLLAAAGGLVTWSLSFKDYDNPKALAEMRKKAETMHFDELVKAHSLKNIAQYRVVTPDALQQKFMTKADSMRWRALVSEYPLNVIHQYQLAPTPFLRERVIRELQILTTVEALCELEIDQLYLANIISLEERNELSTILSLV
ncbi:MAG: hypothetical protein RL235_550, partial [Chlamydiota bacterium]